MTLNPKHETDTVLMPQIFVIIQGHIIIMSDEKHQAIIVSELEGDKVASRRSRKDEEGRDFQCGCGKRYLSYPALYTHIKTKHNGHQPEGTLKNSATMTTKRGKSKLEDETLRAIYGYLDREEDMAVLQQLDESLQGCVPLISRIRRQLLPRQIFESYNNLVKMPEFQLNKRSSLDLVLTVFLLNVGEHVGERLYEYYLIFAKLSRNCYIQLGEQVFRSCFKQPVSGQTVAEASSSYLDNFSNGQVQYFPIICDCLTRYYIPFSQNAKEHRNINLSLIELMLYDFCKWLNKHQLTKVQVELKKEYRLQSVPQSLTRVEDESKLMEEEAKIQEEQGQDSQRNEESSPVSERTPDEKFNRQVLEVEQAQKVQNSSQKPASQVNEKDKKPTLPVLQDLSKGSKQQEKIDEEPKRSPDANKVEAMVSEGAQ